MKEKQYQDLVDKRKKHEFPIGLFNPANIENGVDCNHIGAWSQWQGNLDADILVIGQDWGNEKHFLEYSGIGDDDNMTNKRLRELFLSIGFEIGVPNKPVPQPIFFTNAILGIKENAKKGLSSSVKKEWVKDSTEHFTKELIEIIEPKIIITLGTKPLYAMRLLYDKIPNEKLSSIIDTNPICLKKDVHLFALYHCGGLSLVNRKPEKQFEDWQKIKSFI